jgi:hypothetical protein
MRDRERERERAREREWEHVRVDTELWRRADWGVISKRAGCLSLL